jgi:hypothetical protein
MRVELQCSQCRCRFDVTLDEATSQVLEQITEEGPWSALGDGETFEDRVFSALPDRQEIRCPQCGRPVSVTPETLCDLSQKVLAQW